MELLPDRLPWYITGPALGLLVVGLFVVANQPLGASGAYVQTLKAARRDSDTVGWRVWYFGGIFVGGLVATVLGAGVDVRTGYDAMFTAGWSKPVVGIVVFLAAIVMGYGARMAGGCTSGHGICGTAQRSPASWAATATFVGTAVGVTFLLTSFTSLGDLTVVDGVLTK
ncbi:MAG: YeeE/YedE family protein [Ilumatobacteraceae bacterium]